jgi:NlpC/P60 family putative phage cell wall peptidase
MNRVVTEAREWIGTPYRHQHATKGAGCDCLGLLRGVYRAVVGPEPETPPPYSPSWGEAGDVEFMLDAAGRHLAPVAAGDWQPGDVLVFRMRRSMIAKHCGILTEPERFIHADAVSRVVHETHLTAKWRSRVAGVFRIQWQIS